MLKYLIPTGGFHPTRILALQFFDLQHEDHHQLKPGPVPLGHHVEGKLMRMRELSHTSQEVLSIIKKKMKSIVEEVKDVFGEDCLAEAEEALKDDQEG